MGIRRNRVAAGAWAMAGALAAVGGLFLTSFPAAGVTGGVGVLALAAIPAVVLGGFDSPGGAVVGGLIIGVVEAMAGFYLPEGFKDIAAYVVVLFVLWFMPSGIFGETARKKV
jgi:branched-chain amino acid transport system permease protein